MAGVPGTRFCGALRKGRAMGWDMPKISSELISLRARVPACQVSALHAEAVARRVSTGRLIAAILAEALPALAADRVRRSLAPDMTTPPERSEGVVGELALNAVTSITGHGREPGPGHGPE